MSKSRSYMKATGQMVPSTKRIPKIFLLFGEMSFILFAAMFFIVLMSALSRVFLCGCCKSLLVVHCNKLCDSRNGFLCGLLLY